MMKRFAVAAGVICLASGVHAAECSLDTTVAIRAAIEQVEDQARRLRQVTARADSQDIRLQALPQDVQATLPPRPAAPVLDSAVTDAAAVTCDADGNAADFITTALAVQGMIEAELQTYQALVAERELAIVAAEDSLTTDLPAADQPVPPPTADSSAADSVAAPDSVAADDNPDDGDQADDVIVADAAPEPAILQPLRDPGNEAVFRRVVSLPDAALRKEPGMAGEALSLPTFSVLYVYDTNSAGGGDWLMVGSEVREGPVGWISADAALPWSTMLVMQFAPRGQRERVMFFRDAEPLSDLLNSPMYTGDARLIYADIADEQAKLADDPTYEPNWPGNLVAIEPAVAVTFANEPYLLPILDWRPELIDGVVETTLLQVAAIPAQVSQVAATDSASFAVDAGAAAANDGEFRVGVVFVVDTTISMAPFINRTKQVVNEFFDAFGRFETSAFVSFGFVGFRDSVNERTQGVEYVTRIFQPIDPEASARQVMGNLDQVQESQAPTLGFQEDVFAGLTDAIEAMDWSPFDARIIILVTDASARSGNDPLMRDPGTTAETIAARARANNITIVPIHLVTPANTENGDIRTGEMQYRILGETGDAGVDKYLALDATSDTAFLDQLQPMADGIARAALAANSGLLLDQVVFEPIPQMPGAGAGGVNVAQIVTNEIFRAQLESLARVEGGAAPAFLAGWAADRDITDPSQQTLDVSVFLTRNQLSTMTRQLDVIVGAFRSGDDDPQAFFDKLQGLAAEMSTDPDAVRADDRLAVRTLMPTFLQNLPYKSDVLRLDREYWQSLSNSLRQEFIESIEAKQKIYQDTFDQTNLWNDFGSDDPALAVTLIQLRNLP